MVHNTNNHFLYFAYGSNMFKKRIRINIPSAVFVGIGVLQNYRLDFVKFNVNWQGSVATIVPTEGENVWGAIWRVHKENLAGLDRQEGVAENEYIAKLVDVRTSEGLQTNLRTYQHTITPSFLNANEKLPVERRPSITYLDVIIKGAVECNLPECYIDKLKNLPDNGLTASVTIRKLLNV